MEKSIICVAEISRIYGISKVLAARFARESGLVLPRAKGQKICVNREAFERWMKKPRS